MAERPTKRLRRLSTEYDDSEGNNEWMAATTKAYSHSAATPATSRPRRGAAAPSPSTTIERNPAVSLENPKQSIRLTVKAPPSKLRQATSGTSKPIITLNSRDRLEGGETVTEPRSSRNRKAVVEESSEEEEEEADEESDEPDDTEDDEEADDDTEGEDDDDAEGEEDAEMRDAPLPALPYANQETAVPASKPTVTLTPARHGDLPSVEDKEMALEDDDDDEELSELDDDEEDVEGEDEDAEGEEDDDDETPGSMSRSNTPDLSKLTRRQRAAFEEYEGGLMALSNEAQKKKHLTAEEHAMRRAEMARRRKNLSEKRNEEEKMDTINRLLKKQAPKRRGRATEINTEEDEEPEHEKPSPIYVRYVQNGRGSRVAVPEEWLAAPVGRIFTRTAPAGSARPLGGRMVEEVESTA